MSFGSFLAPRSCGKYLSFIFGSDFIFFQFDGQSRSCDVNLREEGRFAGFSGKSLGIRVPTRKMEQNYGLERRGLVGLDQFAG